jgi:hypothetical protein
MTNAVGTYAAAVPYWKRWLLRYVIREAPAISLQTIGPADYVVVHFGKPHKQNTVEKVFKW